MPIRKPDHQVEKAHLLKTLLPQGRVVTECPLSTADGVDVAWLAPGRRQEVWICDHGTLQFHFSAIPKIRPLSGMCPTFPPQFDL
jgi:hypothetical protein